ncbi:glycoside hydrolase family 3 protein [uncultured Clostridium sp.]|uniref:glycoside hydrolase family 3 protein n=1 Tax=uncultured Clostridium sp. TaxID=59620 RepID=UPI0025910F6F|nr:glycoside hydrolase family 3 protein [uncultured Clostridium sp.]MDU1349585.1 glycoside hydrolase family 3 protein [Clostridium argentinense]
MKRVLSIILMVVIVFTGCSIKSEKEQVSNSDGKENTSQGVTKPEETLDEKIEKKISSMTIEEKVGQLLMPSIDTVSKDGEKVDFTMVTPEVEEVFNRYNLGGIILFKNNLVDKEQTKKLTEGIENFSKDIGILIGTDEEGGIVTRIPRDVEAPDARTIGDSNDSNMAFEVGKSIGKDMKNLGLNLDFAPVMDVDTNPENPVIGIRAFSNEPGKVAEFGVKFMEGLKGEGIISSIKHFPGHGDTVGDSHKDLVSIDHSRERINEIELHPFKKAIESNVDMIMVGHIQAEALDDSRIYSSKQGTEVLAPATFSSKIIGDVLRGELGFQGVVITDALDMGAITNYFTLKEAAVNALKAGVNILLMPAPLEPGENNENFDEVFYGIIEDVKSGNLSENIINDSLKKILKLKYNYGLLKLQ